LKVENAKQKAESRNRARPLFPLPFYAFMRLSMRCLSCNYDLIGLAAQRCPECGRDFDPADEKTFVSRATIPSLEKQIGRVLLTAFVIILILLLLIFFAALAFLTFWARGF
jgi:hypothetical protein